VTIGRRRAEEGGFPGKGMAKGRKRDSELTATGCMSNVSGPAAQPILHHLFNLTDFLFSSGSNQWTFKAGVFKVNP